MKKTKMIEILVTPIAIIASLLIMIIAAPIITIRECFEGNKKNEK